MQYVYAPVWGSCPVIWIQQPLDSSGGGGGAASSCAGRVSTKAAAKALSSSGRDREDGGEEEEDEEAALGRRDSGDAEGADEQGAPRVRRSTRRGRRGRRGRPKREGEDNDHLSETDEEAVRLRQVCQTEEEAGASGLAWPGGPSSKGPAGPRSSPAALPPQRASAALPHAAPAASSGSWALEVQPRERLLGEQLQYSRDDRAEAEEPPSPTPVLPSLGSVGHPHSCALACKYAKKSRGCKDGADCSRCHLCKWNGSNVQQDPPPESQRPLRRRPPAARAAQSREPHGVHAAAPAGEVAAAPAARGREGTS